MSCACSLFPLVWGSGALLAWASAFVLVRTFMPDNKYDIGDKFSLLFFLAILWPLAAVIAVMATMTWAYNRNREFAA